MSECPPSTPDVTPCPMCMEDGKHDPNTHSTNTCPAWVSLDSMPLADIKGLLASEDLSLDITITEKK